MAACRGGQPVRYRFTRSEWLAVSVIVAVSAALLLSGPIYSRRYHSCALCRLGRTDYRCLAASWSKYEETACTTWYRQNVSPSHEHIWVSSSTEAGRNIFGTVIWIADGDPRALFRLSPLQQIEIYKRIGDPKESNRLFLTVGRDKGTGDRAERRQIYDAAGTLRDWAESGFAETWGEIEPRIDALRPAS